MNHPATCYADRIVQTTAEIVRHEEVGKSTRLFAIRCPEMASLALPGQFFMIRPADLVDPLIGRPLALFDIWFEGEQPAGVEMIYLVKGKLTRWLAEQPVGSHVEVWGPLGNGFLPEPAEHLVMVAGGIGQTPFLAVAKERLGLQSFGVESQQAPPVSRVTLCYGARTAAYHAGVDRFRQAGVDVHLATDDGSTGHHGLVTDSLRQLLERETDQPTQTLVLTCGPEPMMAAVAAVAKEFQVPCRVSLETPMACGIGICFTCVAPIATAEGWDYRRTCIEGPVFNAQDVVW